MREVLSFLYRHLDHFRRRLIGIFFISIIDGIALFLLPVSLAEFTKHPLTETNFGILLTLVILLYLITLPLEWIVRRYGEALGYEYGNYLRVKFFRALEGLPYARLMAHHSGYLLSLINRVADEMQPFVANDILWAFSRTIVNVSLLLAYTARESVPLALVNILFLLLFFVLSYRLSLRQSEYAHHVNIARAGLLQYTSDFLTNILTVKKLGVFAFAHDRISDATNDHDRAIHDQQRFHAFRWNILHMVYGVMLLGTIGFYLYLIAANKASVSGLIIFVAVFWMLRANMSFTAEAIKRLFSLKAYIKNITDIFAYSEMAQNAPEHIADAWTSITLSNIIMRYDENETQIRIPSFTLTRGDSVCITGVSGQGKTTFLNLLARFHVPQKGIREIDGVFYNELPLNFFSTRMVMISQEVELFSLSLRDNIILGSNTIDDANIIRILADIGLADWVSSLEKGLDTLVGEKGIKLSAGQKQRVNLVRGLLLDRDIYLLDEPTSHLDHVTEERVIQFLEKRLRDKTAVIVSHRPAVQRLCTRFYEFKEHEMRELV
ncbi:ABC transporter ATP-binding protein [Candidatus Uhrbacteria bacterium]|nr:ABC transporter ATP-binding protein [Candidatus Uhrbacteria bacterium]